MGTRIVLFLFFPLMFAVSWPAAMAGEPIPEGPDFVVNTYTTGRQDQTSVAMSPDGSSIVVWWEFQVDPDQREIYAQRFDPSGAPTGAEFRINQDTTGDQASPSMDMDDNGRFVVVWHARHDGGPLNIFGQRFAADGTPDGSEFQVNLATGEQIIPRVAMAGDGKFVVVWDSQFGGTYRKVLARRYDTDGTPLGGEFQVNATADFDMYPDVAVDGAGNFVVTWVNYPFTATPGSVSARRYDSSGTALSGELTVGTDTNTWKIRPRIVARDGGEFAVVWEQPDAGFTIRSTFGRFFDSSGVATSGVFQANESVGGQGPDAAFDQSGRLVVSWYVVSGEIMARVVEPSGNIERCEFPMNTSAGTHFSPVLATDGSGELLAAWTFYEGPDETDVYGRRFETTCEPLPGLTSGLHLASASGGTELQLIWQQLPGATDFQVFEDSLPGGLFATLAGVAADCMGPGCEPELTVPMPAGNRYYLVSGRNGCGTGPKSAATASFSFVDKASDDLGLNDLETFFASIDPQPTDYIRVSLDGCTYPGFEWCGERADFYRDAYLALAAGGGSLSSGTWNKWHRAEGASWSAPVTDGFLNLFGDSCAGAYAWCTEIGLGGGSHLLGIVPTETGSCEAYDNIECGDFSELRVTIGPSRSAVCGF